MKKMFLRWLMITTLFIPFLMSCSNDKIEEAEEEIVVGNPTLSFEGAESGSHVVKVGKEITITPKITNAANPKYMWKADGKIISTELELVFSSKVVGEFFVTFYLLADNGDIHGEILIDVLDKTPPKISLAIPEEGHLSAVTGRDFLIEPIVKFGDEAEYEWKLNGEVVGSETSYVFNKEGLGDYKVILTVVNEDGQDRIEAIVRVMPIPTLTLDFEFESLSAPLGRTITIKPIILYNTDNTTYSWKVDGVESFGEKTKMFNFTPDALKEYQVTVVGKDGDVEIEKSITVFGTPAEGEYYRKATANSSPNTNEVYSFLPAPGQFVNEGYTANTMKEANNYAYARMQQDAYVSLGGFGGYIIVGFDHSIDNKKDSKYHFGVIGNAFAGSSEPGIIWVMQDENGNGLPDDTWYELKGSEYGKPETLQDYAVTYYKPSAPEMPVQWVDNKGQAGSVDYLKAYHQQPYYYPEWVKTSSYTLRGTCLKLRNAQSGETGFWYNGEYDWGYADNFGKDREPGENASAGANANYFSIANAVHADGRPANLQFVDFIKVQTGVNGKSGWLGEISTEVFGFVDVNIK